MQKTVNPVWSILDVCHIRLIRVRQYGRKKKTFLLCILAKILENIKFLEIPRRKLSLKFQAILSTGGPVGINGLRFNMT